MRSRLTAVLAAGIVLLAGCSGGTKPDQPYTDPNGPSGPPPSSTTSSTPPSSIPPTSSTPSVTSTSPTVPVDQIPPGHPSSWVPAGVPTTAKYPNPGSTAPRFTPVMFQHTQAGAEAMARYYLRAVTWSWEIPSGRPVLVICKVEACTGLAKVLSQYEVAGKHRVGEKESVELMRLVRPENTSGAEWTAVTEVDYTAGALVGANGSILARYPAGRDIKTIYLQWTGKIWRVIDDVTAPR